MRTFVAIDITNELILDSISKIQSELKIKAKPVDVKNIHFTIQFLGEITESMSENVQKALRTIEFEPFLLSFTGIGAFPKPKFPRVIWIGTDDIGGNKLKGLADRVEDALSPLGFKRDKSFKPHVTIFRIKNKIGDITKDLEIFQKKEFGTQQITQIKFKKSVLTPTGPIYSDLLEINAVQ